MAKKVRYTVPKNLQCGYKKEDGKLCEGPLKKDDKGGYKAGCRFHWELVEGKQLPAQFDLPDLGLASLQELDDFISEQLKKAAEGKLDPKAGGIVASLGTLLLKIKIARQKLDPVAEARREATKAETQKKLAEMTDEQARAIASGTEKDLLNKFFFVEVQEPKQIEDKSTSSRIGKLSGDLGSYMRELEDVEEA